MRSLVSLIVVSISLAVSCSKGSNGLHDKTERPLVIGPLKLSDPEIADLRALARTTGEPWLIRAEGKWVAHFYLSPETETDELRRGAIISARAFIGDRAWSRDHGSPAWRLMTERDSVYAQVAVEGRSFDELQGDHDVLRPFIVEGQFEDAELISLIKLIRSKPMVSTKKNARIDVGPAWTVAGDKVVSSVIRHSEDRVDVWIDLAPGRGLEWVELLKAGDSWDLVSVSRGMP